MTWKQCLYRLGSGALLAALLASCSVVTVSPPLTSQSIGRTRTFGGVQMTSGTFDRPHRIIGVFQMTQTGYLVFHEVEANSDATPGSILYKAGLYAAQLGADGVQNLVLLEINPQTDAEKLQKQVESANRLARGESTFLEEGTETRWEIRGEIVQFLDGGSQ